MPALLGFCIALTIALTGVGAGTLTVPLLMLFLGVPAPQAVALGLTFAAAVKLLLAPAQIVRRAVSWPVLRSMLLGGLPGVLLGSLLLQHLEGDGLRALLQAALGLILIVTASTQILFHFRPARPQSESPRTRSRLLAALMLPVGAEVGFSSAGAGALGSAALLAFTALAPAQIIGTDFLFGAILSLVGAAAHGLPLALHAPLLLPMLLGGLPGAMAGMLLATRLPRRPLRLALWLVLLTLGGQLLHSGLATPHTRSEQRLASASLSSPIHPKPI